MSSGARRIVVGGVTPRWLSVPCRTRPSCAACRNAAAKPSRFSYSQVASSDSFSNFGIFSVSILPPHFCQIIELELLGCIPGGDHSRFSGAPGRNQLQNPSLNGLSDLLEPFFPAAFASDLQFHVERGSEKNLLRFFLRRLVLRDVSKIGSVPIKNQRTSAHKCS